jgi:glycosyltransferase involved in cell wall biosynthesis
MMKLALLYSDAFATGGYPRDVRWLAGALKRNGIDVTVFGSRNSLDELDGLEDTIPLRTLQELPRACGGFDVIHLFGLFVPTHLLGAMVCSLRGVPFVISPMAHLLPLHLGVRRRKKELFLRVAWTPWMRRVSAFHVFSKLEADSVRKWVPHARVFEGTVGIYPSADDSVAPKCSPEMNGARHFLFFGRNDVYQKGLDILLEGFAIALKSLNSGDRLPMTLTIAGKPWNDSSACLENALRKLKINNAVRMVGPVDEQTRRRLLASADYLVFLSRWDGPPRPIREAIAEGTPVVVTPETNMGELVEKFSAGLQVRLKPEEVAQGLLRSVLDSSLLDRSRRGVEQLKRHLAWDRVAKDYIKGYENALCRC